MATATNDQSVYSPLESVPPRIAKRYETLWRVYEDVLMMAGEDGVKSLHMNTTFLANVVVSYFDDLDKYKAYHGIVYADPVKQSAFTMKWIMKKKPIVWLDADGGATLHLIINEVFAFRAGMNFLELRPALLSESFVKSVLYTLSYRSSDENSLFPICDLLWRISQGAPESLKI